MASVPTLAEALARSLARHGVKRLFGIPGGGSSLELIEAAGAAGLEFVLNRTETAAAIMAAVTGELSETPGVVLTGIGPGAASAVNGVAYAYLEKAPLLLLTDGPASSLHQAFDQTALFRPVTKSQGRLRPDDGAAAIEDAVATAMALPWGPVHLDMTAQDARTAISGDAEAPVAAAAPRAAADLEGAKGMLATSRRPVLIGGLQARHGDGPAALRSLAETLGCPVLLTYKAKGVLPDDHPNTVGMVTGATIEATCLQQADLIVLVGFDPVELIPGKWPYGAPTLDLCTAPGPDVPAPPALRVAGPLGETVAAALPDETAGTWTAAEIAALRDGMRTRLSLGGAGHTAETVIEAAAAAAPAGCRLAVDSGAHMFSPFVRWPAAEPFGVLKSNGLSTMGFALPAAIASALEEPERPVAVVTGDGGLMMCLSELTTAAAHRCRIVVMVINDAALSLIDIKQQRQQQRTRGVRYPAVDFAGAAAAMGCRSWRVGPDDALQPVLAEAFAGDGPALIDVAADASGYGAQLEALRG